MALAGRAVWRVVGLGPANRRYRNFASILTYHGVWPGHGREREMFGGVSVARLRGDLARLSKHFSFVGMRALLAFARGEAEHERPIVALTFDDGMDPIASGALAVMDEFGVVASHFVVTDTLNNTRLQWQHRLLCIAALKGEAAYLRALNALVRASGIGRPIDEVRREFNVTALWPIERREAYTRELWQACDMPPEEEILAAHRPYLSWDGLQTLLAHGHEIGLHSASHPFCERLGEDDIEAEIVRPAALLRERLGLDELPFAYPFGRRLPPELEALAQRRARLSCMLGVQGLSPRGTPAVALERVEGDAGLELGLFGRPNVKALLGEHP